MKPTNKKEETYKDIFYFNGNKVSRLCERKNGKMICEFVDNS
jgi:hypothetical protein